MRKIENYEQINENGDIISLKPGIYGLVITDVVDVPDKNYLEVHFDIAKGEFANYYKTWSENNGGKDYGKIIRSYLPNAMKFFKGFIVAVEKSNTGYTWNWDEKTLIGKNVIGEFGEEEYIDKDGKLAVVVKLQNFRSLEAFKEGNCVIPERKLLSEADKARLVVSAEELQPEENISDDLPF